MAYRTRILEKRILSSLKKQDFVVVEGAPGVGKTALLKKVSSKVFDVKKALENPS